MCRRVRSAHGRPSAKNWRSRKSCGIVRKTRNPSARAPLSNVQHPRNRPEKTLRRPRGAPPGGRSRPDPAGGHVRGARGGPVDRGPDPAGGGGAWPAPLKPGSGPPRSLPRAGRRSVATCRTLFPKVVASRRRPRPVAMCGTSSTTAPMPVSRASGRDTPTGAPTPEKV